MNKNGWTYKKLKDVAEIIGGSTPKTNVKEYWDGDYYWVTPAEIGTTVYIDKTSRTITEEAIKASNLTLLPEGTVLLSSRAPIGKLAITKVPMYCNQGFKNIVCSDSLINKYVYYYIGKIVPYIQSLGRGATFKEVSKKIVEEIKIPVPPKDIQNQIISELDSINDSIIMLQQQVKDIDSLTQSLFYEMFGDPIENPKGWEVKKLSEVCDVRDGTHDSPKYVLKSDYFLITSKNIKEDSLDFTDINYISKEDYDAINKRSFVDDGEIIMAMIGTIGKPIIVHKSGRQFCNKNVALIKFSHSQCTINTYIKALLDNDSYKKYVYSLNKGGTQKFVALGTLRGLKIPLPPISLQSSFATKIASIEELKASIKTQILELQLLLSARMQYWFD